MTCKQTITASVLATVVALALTVGTPADYRDNMEATSDYKIDELNITNKIMMKQKGHIQLANAQLSDEALATNGSAAE